MPSRPTHLTLHGCVAAIAERAPERVALVAEGERLGYAALLRRADALAARLVEAGITPEQRVAICLDRSTDLITAMLAVLRAGAAFVPIAPEYPAKRVEYLLADSAARAVIARPDAQLPDHRPPLITLDGLDDSVPGGVRLPEVPAHAAAYVIYTSGSTGRPKGVVVTHANALGLVRDQDYADFTEDETFLQLAPTSFDASAFEIWGALTSGARLVLPKASYQAVDELEQVIREHAVTTLFLTPVLFHEIVRARPAVLDGVRRVVAGGDVLSAERAGAFLRRPGTRTTPPVLVNGYGPTETTTFALTHRVTTADTDSGQIPIGRPLHGADAHLLDADLAPVPPGQQGEIWITGSGVTRGYLGRPGATARSFLPDPFTGTPGARMYRTGDLGRRRADGVIEFIGRIDDQVKVNGFRIEPKEVESALHTLDTVRDAAVVAAPQPDGGKQLVAYVVPEPGRTADPAALRTALTALLPTHLVPPRIVPVADLPRSPAGKLDRAHLRDNPPTPHPATHPQPHPAPPLGRNQAVLAEIWAEVLGVERVGLDDDFFALGGDSMLAIRVVADAEARGVRVSLADMFQDPVLRRVCPPDEEPAETVAPVGAAEAVAPAEAAAPTAPAGSAAPASGEDGRPLPEGVEAAYPATRLQLGLIFEASSSRDRSLYHDVMAHLVEAPLDEAALRTALHTVAATHEVLRTRFDLAAADGPRQLVERHPRLPLTLHDLRGLDAKQQEQQVERIAAEAGRPFDVTAGPLMRVHAAARDDAGFWLVYGFHHAVMDGWSDTVFLADLIGAYAAALAGDTPPSRPAPARYADFVRLDTEALRSPQSREFWRDRCDDLKPTPLRPAARTATTGRLRIARDLPGDTRAALERTAAELRLPLKSLVLAAHLAVIGGHTGADRPVTGLSVNGRPEVVDADRLVGLFLNIVPISADLTGATWADLARQAFEEERRLLPHRRFPYPAIRELAGRAPFDTILNFTHFRLWAQLDTAERGPRVTASRMWDKTSYPLVIDVSVDAVSDRLRIEATGDTALWTRDELDRTAAALHRALTALADDPHGPVG